MRSLGRDVIQRIVQLSASFITAVDFVFPFRHTPFTSINSKAKLLAHSHPLTHSHEFTVIKKWTL